MKTTVKLILGAGFLGLAALGISGLNDSDTSTRVNEILAQPPVTSEVSLPVGETQEFKDIPTDPNCHPSYSGCLDPDASDYDCAGGSGNGPFYTGRVRVIGPDVFGLDRDGDGWGCE